MEVERLKAAWPFGQKFRRPVPNIAPTPPQSFLPELLETLDHFKSVLSACPSTKLPTAQFSTSDIKRKTSGRHWQYSIVVVAEGAKPLGGG